jgi:hypothetical protein
MHNPNIKDGCTKEKLTWHLRLAWRLIEFGLRMRKYRRRVGVLERKLS